MSRIIVFTKITIIKSQFSYREASKEENAFNYHQVIQALNFIQKFEGELIFILNFLTKFQKFDVWVLKFSNSRSPL